MTIGPFVIVVALLLSMSDVHIINNAYTVRSSASGKQRTTVEIRAEPIVVDLDAQRAAKPVAEAIAAVLRDRIGAISQRASDATLRAREAAARAYAGIQERKKQQGEARKAKAATKATAPTAPKVNHPRMPPKFGPAKKPTASGGTAKRYTGGRIGAMPPNQSDRLFHDSGRLIRSIAVGLAKAGTNTAEFIVNVSSNRFDPTTLNPGRAGSSESALGNIVTLLRTLVPEFGDAKALMSDLRVRGAVKDVMANMLQKQAARTTALKEERARAIIGLIRSVAG